MRRFFSKIFGTKTSPIRGGRRTKKNRPLLGVETLEDRQLLTTTVFVDFGLGLPAIGIPTNVAGLRAIDNKTDTGPNLAGLPALNVAPTADLNLQPLTRNFDGNDTIFPDALRDLRGEVLKHVRRIFQPFDIIVKPVDSKNFADIRKHLHQNDRATNGKFDAYVFVGTVTSSTKPAGGSVALGTNTVGIAAGLDVNTNHSNITDEVALVFADEVVNRTPGATTEDKKKSLPTSLAHAIAHEAAHTLGLDHTRAVNGNADQRLLTGSDIVRTNPATLDADPMVTRFSLEIQGKTDRINNYDQLLLDFDIGPVDHDDNKVPDLAYVTGTGAHDVIFVNAGPEQAGQRTVLVHVQAFSDADRTKPIDTNRDGVVNGADEASYMFVVGQKSFLGTDGLIRVDAGLGNDMILIDTDLTLPVIVYGGDGDDSIRGGADNDSLFGGRGNDTLEGGNGRDELHGGDQDDTLEGGEHNDTLWGEGGVDLLRGQEGNDNLDGGEDGDTLEGGIDNDTLTGGSGRDTLKGENGTDELNGGSNLDDLDGGPQKDKLIDILGGDNLLNLEPAIDEVIPPRSATAAPPSGPGSTTAPPSSDSSFRALRTSLTSATGSLSTAQVAALKTGLQQVAAWAGSVAGQLAVVQESIGTILGDTLQRGLVQPLLAYLNSTSSPTLEGVVATLTNLQPSASDQASLVVATRDVAAIAGSAPRFDLRFQATRTSTPQLADLGTSAIGVQVRSEDLPRVPLKARMDFNLSLGVGSTGFFLRLPAAGIEVVTEIDASALAIPLGVGLVDAETKDASVAMKVRNTVAPTDVNKDGQLSASELTASNTKLTQAGSLLAELPFQGQLGTFGDRGTVTVFHENLFDGKPHTLRLAGSTELQQVARVHGSSVLQYLRDIGGLLDQASRSAQMAASLPFTANLKLHEIADLAASLRTQVIDRLVNADGTPNFGTAQELIDRLASAVEGGTSALGIEYDANNKELVFHLSLGKSFLKQAPLSVPLTANFRLGEVQIDTPQVQLQADVTGTLVFGIKLPSVSGTESEPLTPTTPLSKLNGSRGVALGAVSGDGTDLEIQLTDGSKFVVNFTTEQTVAQVMQTIQTASGGRVTVSIDAAGKGLVLTEAASVALGGSEFKVTARNNSPAGAALGILGASPTRTLTGAEVQIGSALDAFFLRDATFDAAVSGTISGVGGSARLGIFDLGLHNGTGTINLAISLQASASGSLFNLEVTPQISGSANINLPIQLAAQVGGISLPVNTGVVVDLPSITDLGTLSVKLEPEVQLESLLDSLEAIAMGQVIEGVKRVVGFLRDVQSRGVFQQRLPVLNRSLADLLDTAEKLDALSRELENNPPTTIGAAIARINQALGSAATQVRFQNRVFEIDLGYSFNKTHAIPLGFDLDDQLNAGILEEFIDVNASAPVNLAIGGTAMLGLVIDLTNPTSPVFAVKDTSQVSITTLANAPDVDLEAAIGPLGIFIKDGRVQLDNGTAGQAAVWSVTLAPTAGGRYSLSSLIGNTSVVQANATGRFDVQLPVAFPTPDKPQGKIHLSVGNLANIAGTTSLDTSSLPNFAAAIGNLDLSSLIDVVITGLDRVLGQIEKRFDVPKLPLIGNDLSKATEFLRDIRQRVIGKLEEMSTLTSGVVRQKIFEAVGPAGLNFLADRNNDGQKDINDITVDFSTTQKRADISFQLAGTYNVAKPIKADLGLPGLGLDIDANVRLAVGFRFDVGFGVSADDGFYLHTGAAGSAPELQITLEASVSNPAQMAQLRAELGFLELTATDKPITQPDGGKGSFLSGLLSLDLVDPGTGTKQDGHLTVAEMEAARLGDVLKPRIDLDANIQLHLSAGVGNNINFPRIETDFALVWQFDNTASPAANGVQQLGFTNVEVSLGQFVDQAIAPLLSNVEKVLGPVKGIAEVLDTRLPVISDLVGRKYTLLDLAKDYGQVSASTFAFVRQVTQFANFANQVRSVLNALVTDGSGFLKLGGFTVDAAAAADASKRGQLAPVASGSTNYDPTKAANVQDQDGKPSGFALPVLSNPSSWFKLLLGQDILLVTYDVPKLDFAFKYEQFFSILGPLGVTLAGQVGATADLSFGYDTRGLRAFRAGGYDDPSLILNGLYMSDRENPDGTGKDIPELELTGGISAFATVNLGFAEFGGGGGLKVRVAFDLNDPDKDGRMYFQEIVGAFSHDNAFHRLINVSGELSASLVVYAEVLFQRFEKKLAEVKLLDFSLTGSDPEPDPVLGEKDAAGVLRLNMGPRAGLRLFGGDTADGDETFALLPGDNPGDVKIRFKGVTSPNFANVSKIVADGGAGNDTITVDAAVTVPVELRGGDGNDTLQGGNGAALLLGGAGHDHLIATAHGAMLDGEEGNDTLQGGAQADTLQGGAGNDSLRGGGGADQLEGGAGDDTLFGEAGTDKLVGDDGQNLLDGGDEADTLVGGDGRDTLRGGAGNDTLQGGGEADLLFGDAGNDLLQGEADADELHGGADNDTLEGNGGNDRLLGEAGIDALFGGLGADFLDGGTEADLLLGGVGADELRGNDGADQLFGEGGVDALFGERGADLLDGGLDSDHLQGGDDNDSLQGGLGADVIDGQLGDDRIQYAIDLDDPANTDTLIGGPDRDAIAVLGTDAADDVTARQISPTTFRVERRAPGSDPVTGSFEFSLPADPRDRDIELLVVSGLGGNDVIRGVGTFNVNQVQIEGDAGDDRLEGTAGDDLLQGGSGTDTLLGNAGRDELRGGDDADVLEGGADVDALHGEVGNDTLRGGADRDVLRGGNGNDRLEAGDDILGDILEGEEGNDTLIGGAGIDNASGGAGDDLLLGGDLGDVMTGGNGNDTLVGELGRDNLDGGDGADLVFAFLDNDRRTQLGLQPITPLTDQQRIDLLENVIKPRQDALEAIETKLNFGQPVTPADEAVLVQEFGPSIQPAIDAYKAAPTSAETALSTAVQTRIEYYQAADDDLRVYNQLIVDVVKGGAGDDSLYGSPLKDFIDGGAGNDSIFHVTGTNFNTTSVDGDTIVGGEGHDTYFVDGTAGPDNILIELVPQGDAQPVVDVVVNGQRTRVSQLEVEAAGVQGLGGDDTVAVDFGQNAAMDVKVFGGDGNDLLDASTFQKRATLVGGQGDDTIKGGGSNDLLEGGTGNDLLEGGNSNDLLEGGNGNDTLSGGRGNDTLNGGAGTDMLREADDVDFVLSSQAFLQIPQPFVWIWVYVHQLTGVGTDGLDGIEQVHLTGGAGNNRIDASRFQDLVPHSVTLLGGAGNDTLLGSNFADQIDGGVGNDLLVGSHGVDRIDGGAGNDTISGGSGNDVLAGGADTDVLTETEDVSFLLTNTQLRNEYTDTHSGFEQAWLIGGPGPNYFTASEFAGSVTLDGGAGSDKLTGTAQADSLIGGPGDDWLVGGGGDDTLAGGDGNDALQGGSGSDLLLGEAGNDHLYGDEEFFFNPALVPGNDTLDGGVGNDLLHGDAGNDSLYGSSGLDSLFGGAGNDTLDGGSGGDRLDGGAGDDYVAGGNDGTRDTLTGGSGRDTFWNYRRAIRRIDRETGEVIFIEGDPQELILDFNFAEDTEILTQN
jgi:Ca2+-binding RTX toxin-like protein